VSAQHFACISHLSHACYYSTHEPIKIVEVSYITKVYAKERLLTNCPLKNKKKKGLHEIAFQSVF
jgi:hypothetical protein